MGNEERGISDTMRSLVDKTFYLPMYGFAESYNLSVATAITLAYMNTIITTTTSNNNNCGDDEEKNDDDEIMTTISSPLQPRDHNINNNMPKHQYNCLLLKGLLNSVSQKRTAHALLKREGIILPQEIMKML